MRKIILSALFFAAATTLYAQNLDDVQEKISKGKYGEAKEKIDKLLADPKNQKSANAWYYKGVIYNELAKDTTTNNAAFRIEAFNALKKGQELDAKNIMGELEQNWRMFDIYNYYFNAAIKEHNAKNYSVALDNYKNAIDVQRYINKKGFAYNNQTLPALDTMLTLYAGSAAFLAKDTATGIAYFSDIANARVAGKDYLEVYQMLVDHYNRRGDKANADKYVALGRELYPTNDYWVYFELQDPSLRNDRDKMLAKYEELMTKYPDQTVLPLDYSIELFNHTYGDTKPADYAARQEKLHSSIQRAIDVNKSAEAYYLMVQHISNQIYDMQETNRAIAKSTKPEDVKKRAATTAAINKKYDEQAGYAEKAAALFAERTTLKNVEKANYKNLLNQLVNYHKSKKNDAKAKQYEDALKSLG